MALGALEVVSLLPQSPQDLLRGGVGGSGLLEADTILGRSPAMLCN